MSQRDNAGRNHQYLQRLGIRAKRHVPNIGVVPGDLAAFTKMFVATFAGDNVRMNNVLPSCFDSLPATEERRQSVPLGRYGTADEVAATIAFLASAGTACITGQNIRVDGGFTRGV